MSESGAIAFLEVNTRLQVEHPIRAKLIVTGADRQEAIRRARRALKAFAITGLPTLLPFRRAVLESPDFTDSFSIHTRWIETEFEHGITSDPSFDPNHRGAAGTMTVPLDIDGKRVMVGFPGNLAQRLGATGEDSAATDDKTTTSIGPRMEGIRTAPPPPQGRPGDMPPTLRHPVRA